MGARRVHRRGQEPLRTKLLRDVLERGADPLRSERRPSVGPATLAWVTSVVATSVFVASTAVPNSCGRSGGSSEAASAAFQALALLLLASVARYGLLMSGRRRLANTLAILPLILAAGRATVAGLFLAGLGSKTGGGSP